MPTFFDLASVTRRQVQWVMVFSLIIGSGVSAREPEGGQVDVSVRAQSAGDGNAAASSVYVALVPMDQPPHRPTIEAVGDGTAKWTDLAPGRYLILADAPAFDPTAKEVNVVAGKSERVRIELVPQFEMSGSVIDEAGNPIAGATVSHPRFVPPPVISGMSEVARRNVGKRLRTTSDANGWWQLPVMNRTGRTLLVEAPGYEPQWVKWEAGRSDALDVTLRKGASLRVSLDRPAPEVLLQLVPAARLDSSIPVEWQQRVWSREATAETVEWQSLPPGQYDLVASWPDPKRFAKPVKLRSVSVAAGSREELPLQLPDSPALTTSTAVRIFVPGRFEFANLQAFARAEGGGAKEVRASEEETIGGRVLYADASGSSDDVWFTTDGDLLLAAQRGKALDEAARAVDAIRFPRAQGRLGVTVPEGSALPAFGDARYHQCTNDQSFVLPVNVPKSGELVIPLLVGCRALTLRFDNYSPVVVAASSARRREEVWLGAHALTGAAAAEIHVVQDPDGASVAGAIVTASVDRRMNDPVIIAKEVAGEDGRVVFTSLPIGEEIVFQAQESSTKLTGSEKRTLEAGQRVMIDPLSLPQAARLTLVPKFDDEFRLTNEEARMIGVHLEREGDEGVKDTRSRDFTTDNPEAKFVGMTPGQWRIRVLVNVEGVTQPVDVGTVELTSGEDETLRPVVRPLLLTGRVTLHGVGVETSLAFTDPPGPGAIRRRVMSDESGAFRVLLPRPGLYKVGARRSPTDPETELGPIQFDASSRNVSLTLPEGLVNVRVFQGAMPAGDVQVTAVMVADSPNRSGVTRFERKARTDSIGQAKLDELQDGTWLVSANTPAGGVAEKTVAVSSSKPTSVTLDLDNGALLEGVVLDSSGSPAGTAAVDCIYQGSGNVLRSVRGEADSWGKFTIHIPRPAPQRLQCGVTTADGAIATFAASPESEARFIVSSAASKLTLTAWSDLGNRDRYWLVGPDGSLFNVSWAARKLRQMNGPLTLRRLAPGAWVMVRVDSPAALDLLGRGGAASLPVVARTRIEPGQSQEMSIQGNGNTVRAPASSNPG